MLGVKEVVWRAPASPQPEMMPFWHVCLPSDEVAKQLVARTMLCKVLN